MMHLLSYRSYADFFTCEKWTENNQSQPTHVTLISHFLFLSVFLSLYGYSSSFKHHQLLVWLLTSSDAVWSDLFSPDTMIQLHFIHTDEEKCLYNILYTCSLFLLFCILFVFLLAIAFAVSLILLVLLSSHHQLPWLSSGVDCLVSLVTSTIYTLWSCLLCYRLGYPDSS